MMNLKFSLNSCLYGILQFEGKELRIYIYYVIRYFEIIIKCIVYNEMKLWLRLEKDNFFLG